MTRAATTLLGAVARRALGLNARRNCSSIAVHTPRDGFANYDALASCRPGARAAGRDHHPALCATLDALDRRTNAQVGLARISRASATAGGYCSDATSSSVHISGDPGTDSGMSAMYGA